MPKQAQAAAPSLTDPLKLPFAKKLLEVQSLRHVEAFRVFVTLAAASLRLHAGRELEAATLATIKPRDREIFEQAFAQLILDMEERPWRDLLGPVYMEIGHRLDKKHGGEFFTPHEVSYLMAKATFGDHPRTLFKPGQILMCNEPACGSGGMVLAATQVFVEGGINPLHVRWVAQDISEMSCYATFINLSLWGIPALVKCGNTIANEVRWQWPTLCWDMARPLIPADSKEGRLHALFQTAQGLVEQVASQPAPTAKPKVAAPFGPQFGPLFGGES